MKHFLFIDESGDHGLVSIDPNFPVFVLCGIVISEPSYISINQGIKDLKKRFWGDKKVILHSRDIRKCDNEFQILFDTEVKKEFYAAINNLITTSSYTIISSAINKENHIKQYGKLASDVYEIALSFIIERSVFLLDDIAGRPHQLEIILEQRGKKEDTMLQEHFQRLHARGTGYVSPERIQAYCQSITFKGKADDIGGLQLADLVAYPIARYVLDSRRANPSFDVLAPKIYTKNGQRYGLKVFPEKQ